MSAYCIKVSEHGDFLTSVFKQEQYMSIFLAAHVLLVSVLNPCFLLHAHFFCAPRKNIDWKTAFYSFCYFRMLLFIELLNPSLLCSTLSCKHQIFQRPLLFHFSVLPPRSCDH